MSPTAMKISRIMSLNVLYKKRDDNRGGCLQNYWPLVSLVLISVFAAGAINWHLQGDLRDWMHYFMGFFLCAFAMLKIFNIPAFAGGFQRYDVIAKKSRGYAFFYTFIEMGLGLGFLSFIFPTIIYILTFFVMMMGAIGVYIALQRGLDINCPCMGSVFKVPLSTVILTEDTGMGSMAAFMFFFTI